MRALFLLAALAVLTAPQRAEAGEEYLGAIVSGAGADTTNGTTAAPFVIPFGSKLTLYCTAAAYVCTDTATTCAAVGSAGAGVPVAATTNFPTSTRPYPNVTGSGIIVSSKGSSVVRIVGAAAVTCYVWSRNGNE